MYVLLILNAIARWTSINALFIALVCPVIVLTTTRHATFLRWSKHYLMEIEESGQSSQFLVGLPSYINHLLGVVYGGKFREESFEKAPTAFLNKFQQREKRVWSPFIFVFFLFTAILILFWGFGQGGAIGGVIPTLLLFVQLGVWVIVYLLQHKWATSVLRMGYYFEALQRWGETINQFFSRGPSEDGGWSPE